MNLFKGMTTFCSCIIPVPRCFACPIIAHLTRGLLDGIICQQSGGPMPTRNVVLTEHQSLFVETLVASGRYQNASEVLREGLRLVEQREKEEVARLAALRQAVQLGIDDIEAGRFREFSSAGEMGDHIAALATEALADS
jgi:antitoxin ParD1/3/4